jgi:hypothetical protein
MKTLKTITLGLIMVVAFASAKATTVDGNEILSVNHAVNTYVNAVTHGQISDMDVVIDQNAKFSMLRGTKMLSLTKDQVIETVKNTENVDQQCTVSTAIGESNNDITIVKVDMKYSTFTRTNYVTLANTGNGWKITSVYSVFK